MTKVMKKSELKQMLAKTLRSHRNLIVNPTRNFMIREAVNHKEAIVCANGALAGWTPWESSGRSPKDTYIVKDTDTGETVDWDSPNNNLMSPDTFNSIWMDAIESFKKKDRLYVTDRVLGADSAHALPVRVVTDHATTALFTDNMFRPVPKDIEKSDVFNQAFTLLVLPYDRLDSAKYKGKLRLVCDDDPNSTSWMAVTMDMARHLGIVYGSAYLGSVKKLMFTVMNYIMPSVDILPIHCSANEGKKGDSALLLGLSGTGKTTLSADPSRALLGDDEHGWGKNGIFNFENGCYAKLINLRKEKEPEIWNAVFHKDKFTEHGAIIENALMYPDGTFDLDDERLTPNSRASYPLTYLSNIKKSSTAGHPSTILFLTADANGVIPPIAKLTTQQAMLWFLMGYTSKLAGTETGIIKPKSTFSRFFGQPFMPRNPDLYAKMLGDKLEKHKTKVFLINTGWSGGSYEEGGKRIDITLTRKMVEAVLEGKLDKVEYKLNKTFHVWIPKSCPGVPAKMLDPANTWKNKNAYLKRAKALAAEFCSSFEKNYKGKGIDIDIERECPGK
jgi:phosphoenolpyruvate carboxykinase (ATP)